MSKYSALFGLAALALSGSASAQHVMQDYRCERDNLDVNAGIGRLDWAVANRIPDDFGIEWSEQLRDRAIHWNDFHPVLRGRPLYPTYGVPANEARTLWQHPGDWVAPVTGHSRARPPAGYVQSAMCTASCYRPEMRLLLSGGYLDIRSANQLAEHGMDEVVVLAEGTTLDDLQFQIKPVKSYTVSLEDAEHDIAVLKMASGAVLKVTSNHTFLDAEGKVLEVSRFKAGDSILRADGTPDRIASIETEKYHGKVYNVTPDSKQLANHVVVAEGYLTGSAFYQNVELTDANRHLLRRNLDPRDLP